MNGKYHHYEVSQMPSWTKPFQRSNRNNQNGVLVHSILSPDAKVMAIAKLTTWAVRDGRATMTLVGRPKAWSADPTLSQNALSFMLFNQESYQEAKYKWSNKPKSNPMSEGHHMGQGMAERLE